MKISAIWPDGVMTIGSSWTELEDALRAQQWRDYTVDQFRFDMRRRAGILAHLDGREAPDISTQSARRLFRDLEACGMLRLEVEPDRESSVGL